MAALDKLVDEVVVADVLIVGSEGAGARAAIEAFDRGVSVVVATKGLVGKTGATVTADADIDVDSRSCCDLFGLPGDRRDSPERFMEDMIVEGEYLGDQRLVEIHCEEAPEQTKQLVDWGAKIDRLTHAPGHSFPRGVWIPGTEFARVLSREIARRGIALREHIMVTHLITEDHCVRGALGVDILRGGIVAFDAKAVVLCTGGAMRIFPHTTAPDELTGDGLAMAYHAGAELVEMEFPMFLPYCFVVPEALDGVDFPYLLSAYLEAYALNRHGERYMKRWDAERMERTTRDVNSIAAAMEILDGKGGRHGGTYISLRHLPRNLIEFASEWLPESMSNWRYGGFDIRRFVPDPTSDAIETAPASHFWNGGVRINERCETAVAGLFAAGEGTGSIHGANRISGNALTMTQVWGPRAGRFAAEYATSIERKPLDLELIAWMRDELLIGFGRKDGTRAIDVRKEIHALAGTKVGVVRYEEGLTTALSKIAQLRESLENVALRTSTRAYNKEWLEALQSARMLDVLEMVARASLLRTESRGALYRRDHPKTDNTDWLRHIVIAKVGEAMELRTDPIDLVRLSPRREVRPYGAKE